jgi:hypothetical protein
MSSKVAVERVKGRFGSGDIRDERVHRLAGWAALGGRDVALYGVSEIATRCG